MSLPFTAFSSKVYITSLFISDMAANRPKKQIGMQIDAADRGLTDTSRKNNYLSLKDKAEILQRFMVHKRVIWHVNLAYQSQPSHDLSSEKR